MCLSPVFQSVLLLKEFRSSSLRALRRCGASVEQPAARVALVEELEKLIRGGLAGSQLTQLTISYFYFFLVLGSKPQTSLDMFRLDKA